MCGEQKIIYDIGNSSVDVWKNWGKVFKTTNPFNIIWRQEYGTAMSFKATEEKNLMERIRNDR